MTAWWISWYHDQDKDGAFELHSPWWVSGSDMFDRATIVAAVQAPTREGAWEVVYQAYDTRPASLQERFCEELDADNARQPWSQPEGRFPKADWMVWETETMGDG